MSLRRVVTVLSAVVVASGSLVAAAPKKADKKKAPTPVAPAKDEPAGSAAPAGEGGGSGSAVDMPEDTPPSDMNGTDENPDAPHDISKPAVTVVAPTPTRAAGYPIEEALRPITLPANMSEVSIAPHANVSPLNRLRHWPFEHSAIASVASAPVSVVPSSRVVMPGAQPHAGY